MNEPRRGPAARFGVLLVCVVLAQTGLNVARPLLSYRTIAFGGEDLAIGLVTAAYAVLSLVVALPLGRRTDRTGRTAPVLTAGVGLLVAGSLLLAISSSPLTVGLSAALLGFGHIAFMVGGQGFVVRSGEDRSLDRDFGLFTAGVSAGQMFGPLTAGFLLGDASGSALVGPTATASLVAAAVTCAGLPAALWLWRAEVRSGPGAIAAARDAEPPPGVLAMLRRPGLATGLFVSLSLLSAVDVLTAYLPLVAEERHVAPSVVGVLLALRSAAAILSRLSIGALAARWSRRTLITVGAAGSGLSLAVVALPASGTVAVAVALVVGGFLLGIGQPLTMTIVVRSVPVHARSAALALRLWSNRLGQVAIPAAAGVTATAVGTAGAIWFSCSVLLAAAVASRAGPRT